MMGIAAGLGGVVEAIVTMDAAELDAGSHHSRNPR